MHHRAVHNRAGCPRLVCILSGVIGGGLAAGSTGVSYRKIGVTLLFWVLALVPGSRSGSGYRLLASAFWG
jgi:hypothetical protein